MILLELLYYDIMLKLLARVLRLQGCGVSQVISACTRANSLCGHVISPLL